MRAAGVRHIGGAVEFLELAEPRALRADEILLDVRACGVGNWDEFVRTGGWDVGTRPPMALGVEAAGLVAAVGTSTGRFAVGDRVAAHSAPLREQGAWAEWFIVPTAHCGVLPPDVSFEVAAALPVPALITSLTGPGKCACWPAEASTRRPTRPGRAPATR
jgi:NADPH:quinone reductase-like Zn-dependent oxidoreductase